MALIRQIAAERVVRDAIVLDLGDLSRQGENLRTRALAEAEAIIRDAKVERERLIKDARALGHAEGLAIGRTEGISLGREEGRTAALSERGSELDKLSAAWTQALTIFIGAREQLLVDARADAVRLAVLIAKRVTKRTVAGDPGVAAAQMQEVLSLVSRRTRLRLAIHPEDEVSVREALPGALAKTTLIEHCDLVTDQSLSRGSCVATTPGGGVIDATIESQLDRIAALLVPDAAPTECSTRADEPPPEQAPEGAP